MPITLSDKLIKENLEFLHFTLLPKPTAVDGFYQLPRQYEKEVINSGFSQSSLQQISDHMGYFLGILSKVKITLIEETTDPRWTVSNVGEIFTNTSGGNYSGLYRTMGFDHGEILLIKKFKYQLKHILALLAHEYAHHYLSYYRVKKIDEAENEILTEVATAFLGLGQLLVNGYKPIVWTSDYYNYIVASGHTTHTATIGYVTLGTIKRAILLSAELRRWDPKEVVNSFSSFTDRISAFFILWPYRNEINKMKRREKQKIDIEMKSRAKTEAQKKTLNEIKKSFQKLVSDFNSFSRTSSLSKISKEDGRRFVEFANDISLGSFLNEIERLIKKCANKDDFGFDATISDLRKRMNVWRRLLDKYQ